MAVYPSVGSMRWVVTLAADVQVQDPNGPGKISSYVTIAQPYAAIQPVSTVAFLLGQQTELGQITHRIIIRWRDFSQTTMFTLVFRQRRRPDRSSYTETYKVHRVLEIEGRQRFLSIDAELLQQTAA